MAVFVVANIIFFDCIFFSAGVELFLFREPEWQIDHIDIRAVMV